MNGLTHVLHVETKDGEIENYEGVLDAMKLPGGSLKFKHDDGMAELVHGEVVRSRVNNVEDAHKYVCPECESDEGSLVTAGDYGPQLNVACSACDHTGMERRDL